MVFSLPTARPLYSLCGVASSSRQDVVPTQNRKSQDVGKNELPDAILNRAKRLSRLNLAQLPSLPKQSFRWSRSCVVIRFRHSRMRARGMQFCDSTTRPQLSEKTKLASSRSVPRHPTSGRTSSPKSMRLLCWIKGRLIRRAAAPLTASSIASRTAVNGYSFVTS